MSKNYYTWIYPDIPADISEQLLDCKDELVIVGVIGRSRCMQANKMIAFGMEPSAEHEPKDGQILCYYKPDSSVLFLHFETTHDEAVLGQLLDATMSDENQQAKFDFDSFYEDMRSRFIRMMLLALHVCHIIVYVETGPIFDNMLITACELLKLVREQLVLKFLPNYLQNSSVLPWLGNIGRVCTPRVLFLFENYPDDDEERTREDISAYEFQTEDNIYDLMHHFKIVNNSSVDSLFALPNNKQYVFFVAHEQLRPDTLLQAISELHSIVDKPDVKEEDEDLEILELAPFDGYVKPFSESYTTIESDEDLYKKEHTVWQFLNRHIIDAKEGNYDEGSFKSDLQNSHFKLLTSKDWIEYMSIMHCVLVENAAQENFETSNEKYRMYLDHFDDSLNFERKFWAHLCEVGLKKGVTSYETAAPDNYGSITHKQLLAEATIVFEEHARGPPAAAALAKLNDICLRHWRNGRQQCEEPSLRGHPCIQPKDTPHEHNSGVIHMSTCNCGRTQSRREDPYKLRQANYEFYEHVAKMCNLCLKTTQYQFPIFEPSISEYRAAAFETDFPALKTGKGLRLDTTDETPPLANDDDELDVDSDIMLYSQPANESLAQSQPHGCSQPLSPTFGSDLNMSLSGFDGSLKTSLQAVDDLDTQPASHSNSSDRLDRLDSVSTNSNDSESASLQDVYEMVLEPKEQSALPQQDPGNSSATIIRQASTTEYLPGLVHSISVGGLLPLFPSWSLVCVGPSSVYSHNTGLQEHFQSGFLSGANFLLPWDVHVRLQRAEHKQQQHQRQHHQHGSKKHQRFRKHGDRLALKIFIGMEYECSRGHRFMMCGPDHVMRGGADIERDMSTQMVNNPMPLYYPCPCRSLSTYLAQLMRVHVVTPKAPVNVMLQPNVRVGRFAFTMGCNQPPRLSQSAYWILRLPYVYQGDDVLLVPPKELDSTNILENCLLSGMFGVAETEADELEES